MLSIQEFRYWGNGLSPRLWFTRKLSPVINALHLSPSQCDHRTNERGVEGSMKPLVSPTFSTPAAAVCTRDRSDRVWRHASHDIESILLHTCTLRVVWRRVCAHVCHEPNHGRDFLPFSATGSAEPGKRSESNDKTFTRRTEKEREIRVWAVGSSYYKRDSLSLRTSWHRSFPRFVAPAEPRRAFPSRNPRTTARDRFSEFRRSSPRAQTRYFRGPWPLIYRHGKKSLVFFNILYV